MWNAAPPLGGATLPAPTVVKAAKTYDPLTVSDERDW